jgi:hypothetical protein
MFCSINVRVEATVRYSTYVLSHIDIGTRKMRSAGKVTPNN